MRSDPRIDNLLNTINRLVRECHLVQRDPDVLEHLVGVAKRYRAGVKRRLKMLGHTHGFPQAHNLALVRRTGSRLALSSVDVAGRFRFLHGAERIRANHKWLSLIEQARRGQTEPLRQRVNQILSSVHPQLTGFWKRDWRIRPNRASFHSDVDLTLALQVAEVADSVNWTGLAQCPRCSLYFDGADRRRKWCSRRCRSRAYRVRYGPSIANRMKVYMQAKRMAQAGLQLDTIEKYLKNRYGETVVSQHFHPERWKFLKEGRRWHVKEAKTEGL